MPPWPTRWSHWMGNGRVRKRDKDAAKFQAADVTRKVNNQSEYTPDAERQRNVTVREFLFPSAPTGHIVTTKAVGKRLKRHVGEPVTQGGRTLILKEWRDPNGGPNAALTYYVQTSDPGSK